MSEVKVNKISPRSGTNVQLGDSGDTITVPSGVTFDASSGGLAGTLTTAAQPNITSVGTLTSLNVDASAGTGVIGITLDNGTVTTSKDSASFRSQLSMYNTTGQVGRFDTANDDLFLKFADDLAFQSIAGSEYMRIDSSGNVGIGTSSPNNYSGYKAITINGTTGGVLDFTDDGVLKGQIFNDASAFNLTSLSVYPLIFKTNSAERMRIDPSGNVGIGTSSPAEKLNVVGNIRAEAWSTPKLQLKRTGNTAGNGYIECLGSDDSVDYKIAFAEFAGAMSFDVGGSERMRIDSSGRVGIGTTSPTDTVSIGSFSATGASSGINLGAGSLIQTSVDTTSYSFHVRFKNPNSQVGTITTSGTSTSYNTTSDYRLKENVNYDFDATTRLKQLKPARFNFIADADTTVDGFLAHEVSSIVPEAISGEKDAVDENGNPDYQGIDQSKLVPLLVKTIQELEARITQLENN